MSPPTMAAPPLESIRTEVLERFRVALGCDEDATLFPNLLDVEQQLATFVQKLGQASSEVESAHRHVVQQRMKIPGAWWHPDNVPGVLALRTLRANGWWDQYWSKQRRTWRQRAESYRRVDQQPRDVARAA